MPETLHVVCPQCQTTNRLPAARLEEHAQCGKCHQRLFEGRPYPVDANGLDRHVNRNDLPVLVDFWAEWCGPCQSMAPVYEQAAERLEPRLRLLKLDTDRNPSAASRFGIRGIPTLILFRGGRERARTSGASNLAGLLDWVEHNL